MKIIGREKEMKMLAKAYQSNESEFVALYGRRRVGKTFLVYETFKENLAFYVTATTKKNKLAQLTNFCNAIVEYGGRNEAPAKTWSEAFKRLQDLLATLEMKQKKVIFIDELPWFDTKKSDFLSALGHFWNVWASKREDILLIVCGSATSWIINKLIRDRGSLHNRVTRRICLYPFTLKETEEYLNYRNVNWERKDIAHVYMVLGGIPFYLKQLEPELSAAQNIDRLCFGKDAPMKTEFDLLYSSLFRYPQKHLKILEALAGNKYGLTREAILEKAKLTTGGSVSQAIEELIQCGFIEQYNDISGKKGRYIYQITDFFSLFYLKIMKKNHNCIGDYWAKSIGSGIWNNWAGQTFEKLCILHIDNICAALSISGIITTPYAWKSTTTSPAAQIDLIIDRADNCINICECKFTSEVFSIDKKYSDDLRKKISVFREETKTKKTLFLTMITTYGVMNNMYSSMAGSVVTLDDLFR